MAKKKENDLVKKKITHFIPEKLKKEIESSKLNEEITITDFIKVGTKAIDVIVGGTYQNPVHMFREYVSNAVDSQSDLQEIQIFYENEEAVISFYDRGKGMNEYKLLLGLIMFQGDKSQEDEDIGELGIGIYAGGKICEKICILTKQEGMEYILSVELPTKKWREITKNSSLESKEMEVHQITDFIFKKIEIPKEEYKDHFTNVQLINLRVDILEKIESGDFIRELCNILPIDFPDDWDHKKDVNNYLNGWVNKKIKVFFNNKQLYRTVPKRKLEKIQTFNIFLKKDSKSECIAKMWIAVNPDLSRIGGARGKYIEDTRLLEGIAIRHKNVELIPREVVVGWMRRHYQRFNYFFGDCHVFKPKTKYMQKKVKLIPRTDRLDFQYDPGWDEIKELITIKIEEIGKSLRDRQDLKSKAKKNKAQKEIDKGDDFLDSAFYNYDNKIYDVAVDSFNKALEIYQKYRKECKQGISICQDFKNRSNAKLIQSKKEKEDEEQKKKEEEELKKKEEEELKKKEEEELKKKEEEELKKKEEEELKKKEEEELKKKEEEELKKKEEEELKKKEEALKRKEEELKKKEEELKKKEEEGLKRKEEEELKKKEEEGLKRKEEEELKKKEEEAREKEQKEVLVQNSLEVLKEIEKKMRILIENKEKLFEETIIKKISEELSLQEFLTNIDKIINIISEEF